MRCSQLSKMKIDNAPFLNLTEYAKILVTCNKKSLKLVYQCAFCETFKVMGTEDGVLDCKDHLLNIQEEYLQDAIDKAMLEEYEKPPSRSAEKSLAKNATSDGFKVVKGAP